MRILVTNPGKFGDILWSMATVREIATMAGEPVDFMTSVRFGEQSFLDLLGRQDYIGRTMKHMGWEVQFTAPLSPHEPALAKGILDQYDLVVHLGYTAWPHKPTLYETYWDNAVRQMPELEEMTLRMEEPWIRPLREPDRGHVFVGWNEQWIELKMGLTLALAERISAWLNVVHPVGSRHEEWGSYSSSAWGDIEMHALDWYNTAGWMSRCPLYFGDLSASWVLANAMGKRIVAMEPDKDRWNPVFWRESPRNTLVRGGDGLPTFDARHCADELRKALGGQC